MALDAYGVSDDNIRIQLLAYASPNLKRRLRFRGTMVLNHRRRGPPDRSDPIRHRLAGLIHETAPKTMAIIGAGAVGCEFADWLVVRVRSRWRRG